MSHQSTHHHHSLLKSIPQTHHHQSNLTAPIKHEIESDDDDVVILPIGSKVPHTPEEYDPECQCDTCQLVRRLQAECTCEECKVTGQPDQYIENVPIANAVSPTNGQPSSSSIQNNDASTSEHTNANYLDDHRSGSSTPDYLPRFFDDESGDSGSDDSEEDDDFVDDNDSSDNESANSDERKYPTSFKCQKCAKNFTEKYKLLRHYRCVHQEWKAYYCRWPNCNTTSALKENMITHANTIHLKSKNRKKAMKYVGKRNEAPPNDPVLEQIFAIKVSEKKKRINTRTVCPQCGRKLSFNHQQSHMRTHANPGYRCTWPKCGFFYSNLKIAKEHISSDHLQVEKANSEQTNQYLIKVNPKTSKTAKVTSKLRSQRDEDHHDNAGDDEDSNLDNDHDADTSSIKPISTFNSNCPKCGRNFRTKGQFTQHFRTHENVGFRCVKCGAFYSHSPFARKHLQMEHFKGKLVSATEINELIIRVDPNMTKSNELHHSIQNNDASTSEYHINGNDQQEDDRPGSSTPDYLPPFFDDDESGDSSSDDSEEDNSVDNINEINDNESKSSANSSAQDHAFTKLNPSKCLKRSYDESQQFDKHTKTIDSKRKHHKCPHCERYLPTEHFKNHIRTHSYSGFRCVWSNCGFFYGRLRNAKKHVCVDHLQVETANSGETNRYLVKVDSRTGETSKIRTRKRHEIPTQQINANDQDDDREIGSKPDYLPPFFDNESGNSSSDDGEDDDDSVDDGDDEDYMELDQVNEGNADDDSDPDYAFSEPLKRSNTKRSSKYSFKTINSNATKHKCKPCDQHFSSITNLKRHYRTIHQQLDSYYCKWSKCDFIAARQDSVIKHITVKHFNHRQNVNKANLYVGKRKLGNDDDGIKGKVCPKCKRKFLSKGRLGIHLRSHKKTGFLCQWPKCNFFYSLLGEVKKHVCADHLEGKVEITNTEKINRYFVKINSQTGETSKIMTKKRLDLNLTDSTQPLTSSHRASVTNQKTTGHPASSLSENESDNNEIDSSNSHSEKLSQRSNQSNSFDCPKCESSFRERHRLLRHYRSVHLDWKPYYCKWPKCEFVAGVDDSVVAHATQKHHQNRQKARSYLGIQKMSTSPPKDPIYESLLRETFHFNCPKCGRNIKNSGHFKLHLAIHKKIGFRCTWPQCGYFYSELTFVKQHIRKEHFMGKSVNASEIHEHFVKVDPKSGRTSRIQCRAARVRTDDEEDSNDDD